VAWCVISGPKRYDYSPSEGEWLYSRDGGAMRELLEDELSRALETKVTLEIRKSSDRVG